MAKLFPETTLTVEGRVYRLVLDINAQTLVEDKASTPEREATLRSVAEAAMNGSTRAARLLFWGALQRHQPDITLAQAGDLMSASDSSALSAVAEAMKETVPDAADVKESGAKSTRPRQAQPPSDGTGEPSRLKLAVGD